MCEMADWMKRRFEDILMNRGHMNKECRRMADGRKEWKVGIERNEGSKEIKRWMEYS